MLRNGILVGLSWLGAPTLGPPAAALGKAGEPGCLSHTIRLQAVLLADKGSRRIRGNYLAGSLFPRFNGPGHCNCSCGVRRLPPIQRPGLGLQSGDQRAGPAACPPAHLMLLVIGVSSGHR